MNYVFERECFSFLEIGGSGQSKHREIKQMNIMFVNVVSVNHLSLYNELRLWNTYHNSMSNQARGRKCILDWKRTKVQNVSWHIDYTIAYKLANRPLLLWVEGSVLSPTLAKLVWVTLCFHGEYEPRLTYCREIGK